MATSRVQVFCYGKHLQNILRFHSKLRQNAANFAKRSIITPKPSYVKATMTLVIPVIPSVHAFWGKKSDGGSQVIEMSMHEKIILQADALYADNNTIGLYALLKTYKDDPVADIQWRYGRAAYEMSKLTKEPVEKKAFLYEAFSSVKRALELDDNSFAAHKWYAILLDSVGEMEGTKQRITNAFLVKEHFMKAIELNKKDATSVHLLGYWCFLFADMPWYQRKVAAVIFASPPTSTYEQALEYFLKAEEIEPNFYSKNLMMLGKTYLRLGDKEQAAVYLKRAIEYPVKTEDDKASHKEAEELLKHV